MTDDAGDIAYCHACGAAMDVSAMAPFTNVECPVCHEHTRVKREFGPYTLMSRHAIGGMSMVFVAQDNVLGREVALKILNEACSANEKRIAAFEQEARLTAALSHPHIVRVFTTGRSFGYFYIAMELVTGGHFEQRINDLGKVSENEVLNLAIEVAQGLKAAHVAGLIHRDIKPGNILLDASGKAKIVDFGLALVTQDGKAKASEIWATPYYVPPEAFEGREEDFRSDMYAFGATFYHALVGLPPCNEESMSTDLLRQAKRNIPPLAKSAPEVSRELARIISRTMAWQPEDRYSSYDALISALEEVRRSQGGGAAVARPANLDDADISTPTRRRPRALLYSLALVALIGATFAAVMSSKSAVRPAKLSHPPPAPVRSDQQDSAPLIQSATDISGAYRAASEAFAASDYAKAAKLYDTLFKNPAVQEPTRTWAGVDTIVCHYLAGDAPAARKSAGPLASHLKILSGEEAARFAPLGPVLGSLGLLHPSVPPADVSDPNVGTTAWMLTALKNWEQGMLEQAKIGFGEVIRCADQGNPRIAALYKLAMDYMADYRLLTGPAFQDVPDDPAAIERALDELNSSLALATTRGRVRYSINARREDLARVANHLRKSATQPPPSPVDPAQVLAKAEAEARLCHFQESAKLIASLPGDPPGLRKSSLLAIHRDSAAFLDDLAADLETRPVDGPFHLAKDELARSIRCDADGTPVLTLMDGSSRSVTWADVPPDAMIDLHRKLIRSVTNDHDRVLRHRHAIAYDWLVGNRNRALAAAATLSATSPAFRDAWDSIISGLR